MKIAINLIAGLLCLFFTACCNKESCDIEPAIPFCTPVNVAESLPSAFPDLTKSELEQDWGKELFIANRFARENDFYRAITGYKRALILIPSDQVYRKQQIEYAIILSYYLANKNKEAVEAFEASCLTTISSQFLAFENLLLLLYDAYKKLGQCAKAEKVFEIIEKVRPDSAKNLQLSDALIEANLSFLQQAATTNADVDSFISTYSMHAKSVKKAKMLNAFLPGAGYYYIGQKNTAFTAFIVNSLFIAAAYYFFDQGNWPAGIITTSLEMGWYIGGINGAGLGAKEYNEYFYSGLAKDYMIRNRLFPVLSFQTSF